MRALKDCVKRVLRWVMTPLRRTCQRRDGVCDATGRLELPNEQLLAVVAQALRDGHTAVIWVKGYSMRPFLEHARDRVKLAYPERVEVGDAVLARLSPKRYVLHRVIHKDGSLLTLQGDGNLYGVEHCSMGDVCGVVTEYIRPARTLLATDAQLCRRIRVWRMLRPVRRVLLTFYRATLP